MAPFGPQSAPAIALPKATWRFAAQQIEEQNRKGGFIHLRAAPVGATVQPHVLSPVSVGFLCCLKVMQHAESVVVSTRCQQSTSALNQIAGPDKVIAAQIFVTLVETPGNGEAGDDSAEEVFGFMRAHDRHAGPVQIFLPRLLVELLQCPLPVLPVSDVVFASRSIRSEQGR